MNELVVAISASQASLHGCPYCNCSKYEIRLLGKGATVADCADPTCNNPGDFVILAEGVTRSPIGFNGPSGPYHPELIPHPRARNASHGVVDKRPQGGGEFFTPLGVRMETGFCLVCHKTTHSKISFLPTLFAEVPSRAAADRVAEMSKELGITVKLDLSDSLNDRPVRVRAGACEVCQPVQDKLNELVAVDHILTADKLALAKAQLVQPVYAN